MQFCWISTWTVLYMTKFKERKIPAEIECERCGADIHENEPSFLMPVGEEDLMVCWRCRAEMQFWDNDYEDA